MGKKRLPLICGLECFLHSNSTHLCFYFICLCDEFCPSYMISEQGKEMEITPAKHLLLCRLVVLCWWCSGSSLQRPVSQTPSAPVPTAAAAAASCGAVLLAPLASPIQWAAQRVTACLWAVFCALHTKSHKLLVVFIKMLFFFLCCLALIPFSL